MRTRILAGFTLAAALVVAQPSTASADWMFTPFVGIAAGGSTADNTTTFGGGLRWMGGGVFGFEADFGFTPDFFGPSGPDFGDNNVTSVMFNIVAGVPVGGQHGPGIRPYATGGVGIIRQRIDNAGQLFDSTDNGWGYNLGGGVDGFFTDNIGVRGDVRYFRNFNTADDSLDLGTLSYWRTTAGLVLRF